MSKSVKSTPKAGGQPVAAAPTSKESAKKEPAKESSAKQPVLSVIKGWASPEKVDMEKRTFHLNQPSANNVPSVRPASQKRRSGKNAILVR